VRRNGLLSIQKSRQKSITFEENWVSMLSCFLRANTQSFLNNQIARYSVMNSNPIFLFLPLLLLAGSLSYADSASAQVQSNQTSTTCLNGKCSTASTKASPTRSPVNRVSAPSTLISKSMTVPGKIKTASTTYMRMPFIRARR
jgi:hypothetical protein